MIGSILGAFEQILNDKNILIFHIHHTMINQKQWNKFSNQKLEHIIQIPIYTMYQILKPEKENNYK